MPTASEFTKVAQDQILESVKQSQNAVVEAVKVWAKAAENAVPAIPAAPFAEELPKPEEIVKSTFAFAEQLLSAQREFALSVLAAAAPAFESKVAENQ